MIHNSPGLDSYVKTLQLTFHDNIVDTSLACEFLSKFRRLRGFHLLSAGNGTQYRTWTWRVAHSVDWEAVAPQLRGSLFDRVHAPGLEILAFGHFKNFLLEEIHAIHQRDPCVISLSETCISKIP